MLIKLIFQEHKRKYQPFMLLDHPILSLVPKNSLFQMDLTDDFEFKMSGIQLGQPGIFQNAVS